ncbi:MAG: four helix bundle protein [Candidatus Staskawiczbacteria bacterium]|jgi:four helix bundle protein
METGSANKIQKFTDLYAWQEGHKLVLMIYKETDKFPDKERYSIIDQMRRAVVSVTSNIAEGFSRKSSKEKNRFYCMAQASLVELQNQLIISRDVGYLLNSEFKKIADQSITTSKLLSGLLRATKDKKFEV